MFDIFGDRFKILHSFATFLELTQAY